MRFIMMYAAVIVGLMAGCAAAEDGVDGIRGVTAGDVDVWCIQDKTGEMSNTLFGDSLVLAELVPAGKCPSSFNVFVLKKGDVTVLIDTGVGGEMLRRMVAMGVKPEDVSAVLLTHSHGDHVGGLLAADGKAAFPNATLWLAEKERPFWMEKNEAQCEKCEKAYGGFKFLTPDEKTPVIFPELTAVDLAGHTPGHVGFLVRDGKDTVFIAADLLHSACVQFPRPDFSPRYDSDPVQAAAARKAWMQRAADGGWLFTGAHLPFPSPVGKLTADGDGFRFTPENDGGDHD